MTVSCPAPPSNIEDFDVGISETDSISLPASAVIFAAAEFSSNVSSKSVPEGVHVSVIAKLVVT